MPNKYEQKYLKYKTKYIKQKAGTNKFLTYDEIIKDTDENATNQNEIDYNLFFDLLQVSKDIESFINENNIIILIGDTPSYLLPFLEPIYKTIILPFSGKPFGCFNPPYGDPYVNLDKYYTPDLDKLSKYFDYLEKNTFLTRKFVKENFYKLVLVDSSSGASIMGVSIFFNRYIGNIKTDSESKSAECIYIYGAKPMKFIGLIGGYYGRTNIKPETAEKYFASNDVATNFNPKLIIVLGSAVYYYRDLFMLDEKYIRIAPHYNIRMWDKTPEELSESQKEMVNPKKVLERIRFMVGSYNKIKKHQNLEKNEINRIMEIIKETNISMEIPKKISDYDEFLNKLFDHINMNILYLKHSYYFD